MYGVLRLAQMYDMTTLTEEKSMRLEVTADEVYMLPPPYMHHPHQQTPVYLEEQTGQKGDQPLHDPVSQYFQFFTFLLKTEVFLNFEQLK